MMRLLILLCIVAMVMAIDGDYDDLVINTTQGKISGVLKTSPNGHRFYAYQSIPYAMPPVGHLRLRDPVPGMKWEGIRDGGFEHPMCPQFNRLKRTPVYGGDEDCLYLNVYTPKPRDDGGLPVMVYIFGGADREGNAIVHYPADGLLLLDHPIVLVIVQYRLGILSYTSTEDSIIPGNFGLKDQTLALRWVRDNIRAFGGDPSKVTLFGNSSGSKCVHAHILSPHSRGLFVRAIIQSGTMHGPNAAIRKPKELAFTTGRLLGCPNTRWMRSDHASSSLLNCLQSIDVKTLTLSIENYWVYRYPALLYFPRVDGDFLPDEPQILMKEGRYNLVQIMSGVTKNEGSFLTLNILNDEDTQWELMNKFDDRGPSIVASQLAPFPSHVAQQLFQYYVGGIKVGPEYAESINEMVGDVIIVRGQEQVTLLHLRNTWPKLNTFYYVFRHVGQRSLITRPASGIADQWVAHGDELFYMYNSSLWLPLERKEDQQMSEIITKLWTNFAATGNPTPDDSLGFIWEPASPDNLKHLSLTLQPKMQPDTNQKKRAFLDSLLTRENLLLHPEKIVFHGKQLFLAGKHEEHNHDDL